MTRPGRTSSYGQDGGSTIVDRFGVWLSGRAVRRGADLAGARVADFGCGYEASFSRRLPGVARSVTLVDVALDPTLAGLDGVTAVEASIEEALPGFEDGSFDVILCLSVLEHLWRPQEVLGHFHRLLAPDGKLLVNVPSWRGKRFLELSAFRLGTSPANEMDDHKRYYDPRDLWPMLVAAGFKPSRIHCRRHKFGLNTFAVCRKEEAA
jgi:2-polyprenyl-3-methyl-5-hydroxy-6-metoxy-1,4-benzoquinol methylase